ncbi:MAG: helix-turn-helix transcriptional regulator [Deltaproteobacteria bacterium]|nr:helix-turn-helix transcriptional regulator [Deltaproteobacteria bacterium]MBW2105350.1 helix-turn-helix transcriptional regulator [Deltaproteobacteria bacterium]
MQQETTIINADELFGNFSDLGEFLNSEESFEKYWGWPDGIGNGFMSMIKFRPGLMLGIWDYQLWENLTVSFEAKSSPFIIGFSVPVNVWSTLGYGQAKKDVLMFNSGQSFISYLPEWQGIAEYPARTPAHTVSIYIDPLLLNTFMDEQHDRIPTGMHDIVNGANEKHYYHTLNTTPIVNMAIHQILDCPYRGPLKRLYLESKALELITHILAQLVSPEAALKNPSVLRPDDIERIHHARKIISHDLENPPTLFQLARLVGLTHTKLNRGFREIYGTTVFGYLRKIRLEQAKLLLEKNSMNVTEVALSVGYNSLSSFIHAFSDHFGITPTMYIKRTV